MPKQSDDKKLTHLLLEHVLLEKIDDFRFKNRFESRTAAIRWLLDWAVSQKPKVVEK